VMEITSLSFNKLNVRAIVAFPFIKEYKSFHRYPR
jgi:hypothetical protein